MNYVDSTMKIKIVIPIYQPTLSKLEARALDQACAVLSAYSMCFVKPESLNLDDVLKKYPHIAVESFDDKYFKNIIGYNRLLMLTDFYSRFLTSDYILIYQLDAYVFRDELKEWCEKGYDYVGAPWFQKPIYQHAAGRLWKKGKSWVQNTKRKIRDGKEAYEKQNNYYAMISEKLGARVVGDVGNGGLSLRKVKSHYDTTLELKERIDFYVSQEVRSPIFNEDVFWSSEPKNFRYPSVEEALQFSFDKYPHICYKKNEKQLPFGCHGWSKKRVIKFWKKFIDF